MVKKIKFILLTRFLFGLSCLLRWSYRFEYEGEENLKEAGRLHPHGAHILTCWHEFIIPGILSHYGKPYMALTSYSKDGDMVGEVLKLSGQSLVRGSSSKGGKEAREILYPRLENGESLAISVDGPRGPRRKVQPGVVDLARKTGVPILPFCVLASKSWVFKKSWDQTILPKPFSKVTVQYGKPFTINDQSECLTNETFAFYLNEVEVKLNELG